MSIFRKRIWAIFLLASMSLVSMATVSVGQELRRIAGTTLFGAAPAGFHDEPGFPGWVSGTNSASIVVIELPREAAAEMDALFSDTKALNSKFGPGGVVIRSLDTLTTKQGLTVKIGRGEQTTADAKFEKWFGLFTGEKTVIVTFQIDEHSTLSRNVVADFYESLQFRKPLTATETLDTLSFNIKIVTPFRFVGGLSGASVLLMVGPDDLNRRNDQPMMLVVRDLHVTRQDDIGRYAEAALRSTSSFRHADIRRVGKVMFAGDEGIEFDGTVNIGGKDLVFKQRFAVTADGQPLRMVVGGPAGAMATLNASIEQISASISGK